MEMKKSLIKLQCVAALMLTVGAPTMQSVSLVHADTTTQTQKDATSFEAKLTSRSEQPGTVLLRHTGGKELSLTKVELLDKDGKSLATIYDAAKEDASVTKKGDDIFVKFNAPKAEGMTVKVSYDKSKLGDKEAIATVAVLLKDNGGTAAAKQFNAKSESKDAINKSMDDALNELKELNKDTSKKEDDSKKDDTSKKEDDSKKDESKKDDSKKDDSKKDDSKKDESKKDDSKKDESKKEDDSKKDDSKKDETKPSTDVKKDDSKKDETKPSTDLKKEDTNKKDDKLPETKPSTDLKKEDDSKKDDTSKKDDVKKDETKPSTDVKKDDVKKDETKPSTDVKKDDVKKDETKPSTDLKKDETKPSTDVKKEDGNGKNDRPSLDDLKKDETKPSTDVKKDETKPAPTADAKNLFAPIVKEKYDLSTHRVDRAKTISELLVSSYEKASKNSKLSDNVKAEKEAADKAVANLKAETAKTSATPESLNKAYSPAFDAVKALSDKIDGKVSNTVKKDDVKKEETKPSTDVKKDDVKKDVTKPSTDVKKDDVKKNDVKKDDVKKDDVKKDETKPSTDVKKDEVKSDDTKKDETAPSSDVKKDEVKSDDTTKDETKPSTDVKQDQTQPSSSAKIQGKAPIKGKYANTNEKTNPIAVIAGALGLALAAVAGVIGWKKHKESNENESSEN